MMSLAKRLSSIVVKKFLVVSAMGLDMINDQLSLAWIFDVFTIWRPRSIIDEARLFAHPANRFVVQTAKADLAPFLGKIPSAPRLLGLTFGVIFFAGGHEVT